MKFSERTAWEEGENEWAAALRRARAEGGSLIDLTVSNPTSCGLGPALEGLLTPLADPRAALYSPEPFGVQGAREAVAAYYGDHGAAVSPASLCLTTSTSEAYSFLFRLLCDPGDEVLIARPTYPLFDMLARLDDVVLREYPLFYEPGSLGSRSGRWSLDVDALRERLTPRTRAIVVVHPNNPTGHFVSATERTQLEQICTEFGLALIVDEVFLDYRISGEANGSSFTTGECACLCFVLSGLSKVCALPQMKLSWIAVRGPKSAVDAALHRLEIVADTFLSLNAPVQFALGVWLRARRRTQDLIRSRLELNLAVLDDKLRGSLADRLCVEGGWTVVLRVPRTINGTEFALQSLASGAIVQPGEFYGLPAGRIVLSLLTEPERWSRGLERVPIRGEEG